MIDHDVKFEKFLQRCLDIVIRLNASKMKLRQRSVTFLGHIITKDGLMADPAKIEVIRDMPCPTDVAGVQCLNGFVSYLANFLPGLSDVMEPISQLIKMDVPWNWSKTQQDAFEPMKRLVSQAPVLRFYDPDKELSIQCDAGQTGLDAALYLYEVLGPGREDLSGQWLCYKTDIRLLSSAEHSRTLRQDILSTNQFGFRKKYSTFLALMDLVDNISKNIDEGNYSIGIFLDLSKAFDTIDHTILLDKLCRYGVRGVTLNWFKHYLNDRKQFVSYNNTTSVSMKVTCGVPQGSILGPLLFILYVNDITKVSNIFKINLFADDTSLIHTHDNFEYLIKDTNDELIRISTWLATNKLVLNINKTNYMIFTSRGKSYNKNVTNIKIDGNNIQQVNKTKFLGIIIEEHLNWATHISHLCNIIARNVGILQKLRYFVPAYVLKMLYHSLILSHLQYCTLLWVNSYYSH